MAKEELEKVCWNCNHFFPATMGEATEFGICLNDEEFEPFIEELLENSNYAPCQDLIDRKKFEGDREACEEFEEMESIEIDDNTPLGRELSRLIEAGKLTPEMFEEALLEEQIRNIDWTTMPVDQYEAQLKDPALENRRKAISSLGAMISLVNKEAFVVLFKFLKGLPPPETIEDVHFKKEILRHLDRSETREVLLPYLIDELYRISSNNTTRQWISDIFRFLEYSPIELVREPLEQMMKDKRFSYRLKQKMKNILA
jgi:hypothetical protein